MKKSIGAISLALVLLTVLLSGCASVSTPIQPTITLSPVPPTFTPEPTATQIPSPTAVIPVWTETININSPFEYSFSESIAPQFIYHREEIPDSTVIFNTNTRWLLDVQIDKPAEYTGEASTGVILSGYTESGNTPSFILVYQYGFWSIGYAPINDFAYWQTFENLTEPAQSFKISISSDGRELSIQNDKGFKFNHNMPEDLRLFSDSLGISVSTQVGRPTKIILSKLIVEQLQYPSALTASATSLETPYIVSFENLEISKSTEISPFIFPQMLDLVLFQGRESWLKDWAKDGKFTSWAVDSRAHTGEYAINVIPNGNPVTKNIIPVTIAILNPIFNASGYEAVNFKMWINTTSNPRVASVHNCDSWLNIYYKIDSGAWTHKASWCGENKKESQGWQEISLDFDVKGKSVIQFAFMYEVQNVTKPDPSIYYLIDDLEITAK